MKRDLHSKTRVKFTFKNVRHYFYYWLVQRFIKWRWFTHGGSYFEIGDLVTYNWNAKVHIPSIVNDSKKKGKFFIVTRVQTWTSKDKSALIHYRVEGTDDTGSTSSFWLKKL